jgi:hypothetical protein
MRGELGITDVDGSVLELWNLLSATEGNLQKERVKSKDLVHSCGCGRSSAPINKFSVCVDRRKSWRGF